MVRLVAILDNGGYVS